MGLRTIAPQLIYLLENSNMPYKNRQAEDVVEVAELAIFTESSMAEALNSESAR